MKIRKILSWFVYGGSFSLRPLEKGLFEAVCKAMPPVLAETMRQQSNTIYRIQRSNGNRMTTFSFDQNEPIRLFEDLREGLRLAEINYHIAGEEFKARLYIHRGRLSSLETRKELSRHQLLQTPEQAKVTLKSVQEPGLAEEIDKEEHQQ